MRDLEKMFNPDSVAIIGASNKTGKVGNIIVNNIVSGGYKGKVYPINPNADGEICGIKAYKSILDIKEEVDLVIMSIPARAVNPSIKECGEAGVKNMVVITAGFKEIGDEGAKLEEEMVQLANEYGINIIGPNSLGTTNSHLPLNSSFAQLMPPKGNIAFISQSGAMMVAILDWSLNSGIGFSKVISLGNKADVNEIELIQYLADDEETAVIICYLESISAGDEFLEVMKEVTQKKPVIILKSGSSQAGAKAASSHTGALAGSDLSFDTAFKQSGVLRAENMDDLFDMGLAFSKCPLPTGRKVAIITNAGGGGVVTVDSMEKMGLDLVEFDEETTEKLKEAIPEEGSAHNPIDVLGDAPVSRYHETLKIVLENDEVDSLIIMTCPTASADADGIAQEILQAGKEFHKPIIVVNMGGPTFEHANKVLLDNNVPVYVFPETAVKVVEALSRYAELKNRSYETCLNSITDVDTEAVKEIFQKVKDSGRKTLLGSEAYAVASHYGIPGAPIVLSNSADEAVEKAEEMGFPVVLKIASDKIMHKSDIGGVKVGLETSAEVKSAFDEIIANSKKAHPDITPDGIEVQKMMPSGQEVLVGMIRDQQFGPMIAFGMGGIYVNLIEDVSFRLATGLTENAIDKQLSETKAIQLLEGFRGEAACDIEIIKETIKRVAKLTLDFPEIAELDINPIFAYEEGASALDIKIALE